MPPGNAPNSRPLQFKPTMEALGIVLSFICREPPYSEFGAAKIIKAIQHQLTTGCHVCLVEGERLVAYAGWLPIDAEDGERWLLGKASLRPVPSSTTDAVALTIVSATSAGEAKRLMRACRNMAPQRKIYFKRDYAGGPTRKSKVVNRRPE